MCIILSHFCLVHLFKFAGDLFCSFDFFPCFLLLWLRNLLVLVSCHVLSRKFCFYFIMIDLMFLVFWFVFAVNVSDLFATSKASSHTHTHIWFISDLIYGMHCICKCILICLYNYKKWLFYDASSLYEFACILSFSLLFHNLFFFRIFWFLNLLIEVSGLHSLRICILFSVCFIS
jgi:hypothetical protein